MVGINMLGAMMDKWQVAGGRWTGVGGRWQVAGGRGQVAGGRGRVGEAGASRILVAAILLLGILLINSVSALGVTPARTTLDFSPGLQRSVSFDVINSGSKDVTLVLSAQGELAQYVSISSDKVDVSAAEPSKTLSYSVSLPDKLEPGLHTADIYILELPKAQGAAESRVLATLAVVTQLHVYVPYPGKFAESRMVIYPSNSGGDVTFVFPVMSRGEFDLTSVKANVDIFNSIGEKVDSFTTNSIAVESGKKGEIVYNWNADVPIGAYSAKASVVYDEGVLNFEKIFNIGDQELVLEDITVNSFRLGEIAKLEMLVENRWSEKIADAHIETKIFDEEGDVILSFKSASYDIDALAKQVFVSYWDTAGVREGNYNTEIAINYGEKSAKKNLEFQVSQNDLVIVGLGYVISEAGGDGMSMLVVVLIVVIVLLVLINLLWFFLLRKKIRK